MNTIQSQNRHPAPGMLATLTLRTGSFTIPARSPEGPVSTVLKLGIMMNTANTRTIHVQRVADQLFEVRDDDRKLLGTSRNEMQAVWGAVLKAEETSKSGCTVRVMVERDGREFEEFVAKPPFHQ